MKRLPLILLSALALPLLLTSCQDETGTDESPLALTLAADLCGTGSTRGTQYNTTGSNQTLSLSTFTVRGFRQGALETTYTSLFGNKIATYNSSTSVWDLPSSPTEVYWPARSTLRLYAYANLPTGASAPTIDKDGLTLAYTVPATAAAQNDVLLGYFQGTDVNNDGKATLTFSHPLTAVAITKGTFTREGSSKEVPVTVKSITLQNVYKQGTTTLGYTFGNNNAGKATPWQYIWQRPTPAVMQTVTQEPSGTATALAEASATYGTGTGSTVTLFGQPFILIPQDTSTDQVLLKVTIAPDYGDDVTLVASIKSDKWLAGTTHLYELDYQFPKIPVKVATVTVKALETTTPTTITFEN